MFNFIFEIIKFKPSAYIYVFIVEQIDHLKAIFRNNR
ncbi:hypothetical protein OKW21_000867 [Catalinimonas alkaloidigena]|nr:hypothetical protein [Catalinimonas alkaloidigena]